MKLIQCVNMFSWHCITLQDDGCMQTGIVREHVERNNQNEAVDIECRKRTKTRVEDQPQLCANQNSTNMVTCTIHTRVTFAVVIDDMHRIMSLHKHKIQRYC